MSPSGRVELPAARPRSAPLGWFIAWALIGFMAAFSVAALPSIGMPVLVITLVVLVALLWVSRGRGWPGILTGSGIAGLALAYLHRRGPGEVCAATGDSMACTEYLNPVPFLITGAAAVLLGAGIAALYKARSSKTRST